MTQARVHITCQATASQYDLRFYDASELVVPGWWLGITDSNGQLVRTACSASTGGPEAVVRWLESLTGPDIALQLVRGAREAFEKGSSAPVVVCALRGTRQRAPTWPELFLLTR